MKWSYTKLSTYLQCPFKYHAKYVAKSVKVEETQAMRDGKKVHAILETAITAKGAVSVEAHELIDQTRVVPHILKAKSWNAMAEVKLGVYPDWSPCEFGDPDAYGIGIVDVLMLNDNFSSGIILDWKTGKLANKKYQTNDEVKLHALLVKAHYPDIRAIVAAYCFTRDGSITPHTRIADFRNERKRVDELCQRIDFATSQNRFHTRKGPLCPWCEVKQCKHCKPKD